MTPTDFALRLRAFLGDYMSAQRNLSPNTVRTYRDAFVLFLRYCREVRGLVIERLRLEQIDAQFVLDFLEYLQRERNSSASTRNQRLAALHSFFRYVQTEEPEHMSQCQRILAIRMQRTSRAEPTHLSAEYLSTVLDQPDLDTLDGRRDAVLLSVLYDTGARVQEVIDLSVRDVRLDAPAQVRLTGKGRKIRTAPLMPPTAEILREYLSERGLDSADRSEEPLFTNRMGNRFSRWGIRYLVNKYKESARNSNPDIPDRITPHTFRHTKAMHLLQAGNPLVVIRDLLGHASIQSTEIYARADLDMKRRALEKAAGIVPTRALPPWRREEGLMDWLRSL